MAAHPSEARQDQAGPDKSPPALRGGLLRFRSLGRVRTLETILEPAPGLGSLQDGQNDDEDEQDCLPRRPETMAAQQRAEILHGVPEGRRSIRRRLLVTAVD